MPDFDFTEDIGLSMMVPTLHIPSKSDITQIGQMLPAKLNKLLGNLAMPQILQWSKCKAVALTFKFIC